jgi:hypothetical protein
MKPMLRRMSGAVDDGDSERVATVLGHVRQLVCRDSLLHGGRDEARDVFDQVDLRT